MKTVVYITFLIILSGFVRANAQPWNYNFGNTSGSFTSANSVDLNSFLTPAALGTGGGNIRVRNGSQGGGFYLENADPTVGQGMQLRINAPTGGSANKLSFYGYNSGSFVYMRKTIRFNAANNQNGVVQYITGSGSTFSDNNTFSTAQTFTGLQFILSGSTSAITMQYRTGGSWTTVPIAAMLKNTTYVLEIYGNNSNSPQGYDYYGAQTVASGRQDIWLNGILVVDDGQVGGLPLNSAIDSWMLYTTNSTGNGLNVLLDDFTYSNDLPSYIPTTLSPDINVTHNNALLANNVGIYNYNTINILEERDVTLSLVNLSNQTVTLSNFMSSSPHFTFVGTPPTALPGGQTATLKLRFKAPSAGNFNASISFNNSTARKNPYTFYVTGRGACPTLSVAPIVTSSGANNVVASWPPVPGSLLYRVRYRIKDCANCAWTLINNQTRTSFTPNNLQNNTEYEIQYSANPGGDNTCIDSYSPLTYFRTSAQGSNSGSGVCSPPSQIKVEATSNTSVRVSWATNPEARCYVLNYGRTTTPTNAWETVFTANNPTPSTLLTGLQPNTSYRLRMMTNCTNCTTPATTGARSAYSTLIPFRTDFIPREQNQTALTITAVYPNPATQALPIILRYHAKQTTFANVSLSTLTGKVVYNTSLTTHEGENILELPTSDLQAGIYFLTLEGQGIAQLTHKLVIR